eukprot:GHVN01068919.1.p1 GENE.GHVN01068919.1~~GHVN01068919.1.p1  ORF type:complete len:220 (-),score=21.15 GHVN01068919.1:576-1235(-)
MPDVTLRVYDISKGMAATMSQPLLGRHIEGVWHTGLLVYDTEYFYGGGIVHMPPADVEREYQMTPLKTIKLGATEKSKENFHRYLISIQDEFNSAKYDLLHHNCNHFTEQAARWLLGSGIPSDILHQHEEIAKAPLGGMILNIIKSSQQTMQEHALAQGEDTIWTSSGARVSQEADPQKVEKLKEMGFTDEAMIKRCLKENGNDVERAINAIADAQDRP